MTKPITAVAALLLSRSVACAWTTRSIPAAGGHQRARTSPTRPAVALDFATAAYRAIVG